MPIRNSYNRSWHARRRRNYSGRNRTTQQPNILQQTVAKAPKETNCRLIFTWQKHLKRYATGNFRASKTDNKMSTQEMEEIFRSLKSAKHYRADDGSDSVACCALLVGVLFVVSVITYLIVVIGNGSSPYFIFIPMTFVGSIVCLAICFLFCLVQSKKWFISRLQKRESSMKAILTDFNRAKYDSRGIYLKVGTYGAWIEFELTYKYSNNGQGLGVATADNLRNNNLPRIGGSSGPSGGRSNPVQVLPRPRTPQRANNVATNQVQPINVFDARPAELPQGIEAHRPYVPPAVGIPSHRNQAPGNDLLPILDVEVPEQDQKQPEFQKVNMNYPAPPSQEDREYAKVYNNGI